MTVSTCPKLRIAIIGGGLGGLVTARAIWATCGPEDVEIDVYEATSKMTEIGAGLVIWPRTWNILKRIGLEEHLMKLLAAPPTDDPRLIFRHRKSDQQEGVALHDVLMNGGNLRFHRAALQQAILGSIEDSGIRFHLCHRLKEYRYLSNGRTVQLEFQNGQVKECDFVIGADGIKSVVRKELILSSPQLFKDDMDSIYPIWTGTYAYRGLIPLRELEELFPGHRAVRDPMMYSGKNKHMNVYPVAQDQLINVVGYCTDPAKEGTLLSSVQVGNISQEEFRGVFRGWEPEVQAIIGCIKNPTRWAVQALRPLSRYGVGRVLLIGDAAHAMTPHLGSGAGQAIEDGFVLAHIMKKRTTSLSNSIPEITETYNRIRQPFGNEVLNVSRTQGLWCDFNAPGLEKFEEGDEGIEYVEELKKLMRMVHKAYDLVWDPSIPGVDIADELDVV